MLVLVGSKGRMGKRYSAILSAIGYQFVGIDIDAGPAALIELAKQADHFIIATPTDKHWECLTVINEARKGLAKVHVLCEKPITKKEAELDALSELKNLIVLQVNQYMYLPELQGVHSGITYYNYFHSGDDEIIWDTIQLHLVARSRILVEGHSPIWNCIINGVSVDIRNMDGAYISMLVDFLGEKKNICGEDIFVPLHKKIFASLKESTSKS